MQTGPQEIEGTRYYLNASGIMQTGWKWFDNHYSYFTSSGAMKTGWLKENRLWYYLDTETGQMVTGIHKVNDETYYFDANGAMQTGWKQLDGKWYYFQADGSLLRNGTIPDGYKVNAEGVWTTSKFDETTKETKVEHKQDKVTETTQVVTKETNTETNSSVVIEKNQAPESILETTEEKNQLILRCYLIFRIKKNTSKIWLDQLNFKGVSLSFEKIFKIQYNRQN